MLGSPSGFSSDVFKYDSAEKYFIQKKLKTTIFFAGSEIFRTSKMVSSAATHSEHQCWRLAWMVLKFSTLWERHVWLRHIRKYGPWRWADNFNTSCILRQSPWCMDTPITVMPNIPSSTGWLSNESYDDRTLNIHRIEQLTGKLLRNN